MADLLTGPWQQHLVSARLQTLGVCCLVALRSLSLAVALHAVSPGPSEADRLLRPVTREWGNRKMIGLCASEQRLAGLNPAVTGSLSEGLLTFYMMLFRFTIIKCFYTKTYHWGSFTSYIILHPRRRVRLPAGILSVTKTFHCPAECECRMRGWGGGIWEDETGGLYPACFCCVMTQRTHLSEGLNPFTLKNTASCQSPTGPFLNVGFAHKSLRFQQRGVRIK